MTGSYLDFSSRAVGVGFNNMDDVVRALRESQRLGYVEGGWHGCFANSEEMEACPFLHGHNGGCYSFRWGPLIWDSEYAMGWRVHIRPMCYHEMGI